MTDFRKPRLTDRINLPGGQDRLRQMILYVAQRCAQADRFGWVKLNKILWKADFDAYAARGIPITGRGYQRLPLGPAAKEMRPLLREMQRDRLIRIDPVDVGARLPEYRTVALVDSNLSRFTDDDLAFVDKSIEYYWNMTGTETSDDSHGVAWDTHHNGDPLPYELARLSDKPLSDRLMEKIAKKAEEQGWVTQ